MRGACINWSGPSLYGRTHQAPVVGVRGRIQVTTKGREVDVSGAFRALKQRSPSSHLHHHGRANLCFSGMAGSGGPLGHPPRKASAGSSCARSVIWRWTGSGFPVTRDRASAYGNGRPPTENRGKAISVGVVPLSAWAPASAPFPGHCRSGDRARHPGPGRRRGHDRAYRRSTAVPRRPPCRHRPTDGRGCAPRGR